MSLFSKKITDTGKLIWKSLLSFLVVFVIGMLGTAHYRSRKKTAINSDYQTMSGNMVENPHVNDFSPKHQVLQSEGVRFDINQSYTELPLSRVMTDTVSRKLAEGWKKIRVPDKLNPSSDLKFVEKDQAFEFFISPDNKISGYSFVNVGNHTKVMEINFDLDKIKNIDRNGEFYVNAPKDFNELMPEPPMISMDLDDTTAGGFFICRLHYTRISYAEAAIDDLISKYSWEKEIFGKIIEKKGILQNKKMISARKNGILCNIILTKNTDNDGVVASYRFSKIRNAEIRR